MPYIMQDLGHNVVQSIADSTQYLKYLFAVDDIIRGTKTTITLSFTMFKVTYNLTITRFVFIINFHATTMDSKL